MAAVNTTVVAPALLEVTVEPAEVVVVAAAQLGPPGPQGPPGGTKVTGWWQYSTAATAPPAKGEIRTVEDAPPVGATLTAYVSHTDDDGLVWQPGVLQAGDSIIGKDTSGNRWECKLTSVDNTVDGPAGYSTLVGTMVSTTGTAKKNVRIQLTLVHAVFLKVQDGHTWAIPGIVAASDRFPGFTVPVITNNDVRIKRVVHRIRSGTSLTFSINRNGNPVAGLTGLVANTAAKVANVDIPLADLDYLEMVPSAAVGSPTDFSATIMLETMAT